jgi:hypothetical protein
MRLIVCHHNLHLWYMVRYVGGIGYYWKFYLGDINKIYYLFISNVFHFPFGDITKKSNSKRKFSFQILKMKIFKIFQFKFSWHISNFFHFPLVVWPNFSNIKIIFLQFPFSYGGMANFFSKVKNKNFHSNFKNNFFKKIPCGINENFFSARGWQIY